MAYYRIIDGLEVGAKRLVYSFTLAKLTDRAIALRARAALVDGYLKRRVKPIRFRLAVEAGAIVLTIGFMAGGWLLRERKSHTRGDVKIFVSAETSNAAGDSFFAAALRGQLAVPLEQASFLGFVSHECIKQTLQIMQKASDGKPIPEATGDLCQQEPKAYVERPICNLCCNYDLIAATCAAGDFLVHEHVHPGGKDKIIAAPGQTAKRMTHAYSPGRTHKGRADSRSIARSLDRSVEVNPTFVIAHVSTRKHASRFLENPGGPVGAGGKTPPPVSSVTFYYDAMGNLSAVVVAGQLPPPQFLPPAGTYACPFKVQITDPVGAAAILYTIGSGSPTTPYAASIIVTSGTTIQALAVDSNFNPSQSAIAAASFVCGASNPPNPPTNVNVIIH